MASSRPARFLIALLASAAAVVPGTSSASTDEAEGQGRGGAAEELARHFRAPPAEARPKVWWHWMNGNVSQDGIAKDLAWMKRIGIGGVHAFEANLAAPQIVDQRLVFMHPGWKEAFRFAVSEAERHGLTFGIAASPGFSETGGPWVPPADGMKKLVWSETVVRGGRPFNAILPQPPEVTGPYLSLNAAGAHGEQHLPQLYRDAKVLAYKVEDVSPLQPAARIRFNDAIADGTSLADGDLATGLALPASTATGPGRVTVDFTRPQTLRSAVVFVANLPQQAITGPLAPTLEASVDGEIWKPVAKVPLRNVPTTVSFAPVTATGFRLVMTRGKRGDTSSFAPAPGADLSAMSVGSISGSAKRQEPFLSEFRLSPQPRVNAAELKAGFALADDYYVLDPHVEDEALGIDPGKVIDLTSRMTPGGHLAWTPPRGHWKVLRLGWSLTGKMNHPAPPEATGLEVDKLDGAAVRRYLDTYLGMYRQVTGPSLMGRHGLSELVADSTEVGPSNWTPAVLEQFRRLRGYDPVPWLPALTGEIVKSRSRSDAFLYDFRRTLAELTATEHYGTLASVAREYGLTVYGESLEGGRSIAPLGDDLDMRSAADVPMAAMWSYARGKPQPTHRADMRGAASVAHLLGKRFVAAESLTSMLNPWAHAPGDLRPMIDAEFLDGINRVILHTSVHQPVDDKVPGLSLGIFGQFFTRHETWAEMAKPWTDYIARNSMMLQQGRSVADLLWFYGEEAPLAVQATDGYFAEAPRQHGYDFVSAEGLLNSVFTKGDAIVSSGGAQYRAIYLGGSSSRMTLPVLRKLASLVENGATVLGNAPQYSPSLADDEVEFAAIVQRLWSGRQETIVGKGRVLTVPVKSEPLDAALQRAGIPADLALDGAAADADVQFVHRQLDDGHVYFVSNRKDRRERFDARFRVAGRAAEIWRADTGDMRAASYRIEEGQTVVPLDMAPRESFFVVFTRKADSPEFRAPVATSVELARIEGPWDVSFQADRGAPASIRLPTLASLSDNDQPGVRYFSGVATYATTFTISDRSACTKPLLLDLGKVGDVAQVSINGRDAGIAWKAPYRVDVSQKCRKGANSLVIKVANLWTNRLIGDQQPNADKITFTTVPTFTAKAPLRPSGLIGPVTLTQLQP